MKSKSYKLLIFTLPIMMIGFFVNLFVNDSGVNLIERAHADVAPIDHGGYGCCQGSQGCEGGEGTA
jgi:hypothetical protein